MISLLSKNYYTKRYTNIPKNFSENDIENAHINALKQGFYHIIEYKNYFGYKTSIEAINKLLNRKDKIT